MLHYPLFSVVASVTVNWVCGRPPCSCSGSSSLSRCHAAKRFRKRCRGMLVTGFYCWEGGDYIHSTSETGLACVEFLKSCFINPTTWDFIYFIFHKTTARVNYNMHQNASLHRIVPSPFFPSLPTILYSQGTLCSGSWQQGLVAEIDCRLSGGWGEVAVRNLKSMGVVNHVRIKAYYLDMIFIYYCIWS